MGFKYTPVTFRLPTGRRTQRTTPVQELQEATKQDEQTAAPATNSASTTPPVQETPQAPKPQGTIEESGELPLPKSPFGQDPIPLDPKPKPTPGAGPTKPPVTQRIPPKPKATPPTATPTSIPPVQSPNPIATPTPTPTPKPSSTGLSGGQLGLAALGETMNQGPNQFKDQANEPAPLSGLFTKIKDKFTNNLEMQQVLRDVIIETERMKFKVGRGDLNRVKRRLTELKATPEQVKAVLNSLKG